ncbi:MAG: hypothetical protein IKP71_03805, partial [Candidatus Riflebacteria bacterium]|nr:hypothetical protein [Candidatus Riflebacteria bacterium]
MTDFLNKIYSIDNIIIYLVIAIAILVVLFVVILLTGKKDQKLEETKRLEALNKDLGVDNAFKEENKQPEVVETTPMPEKYPDILIQSDSTPVPEAPAVPVASVVPETPQMPVVEEPAVDMPIEEVEEKTVTIPFEAVNEAPILVKQEEKPLVFNEEAVSPVITSEPVIQSVEPTSISIPAEPEIVSPAPISVEPVSEPVAEPFVQFDKPVSNMPQINVVDSFKIDPVVS